MKPPPIPTGVVPLPQGPPPTGLQEAVPVPALPPPTAQRPLLVSPGLEAFRSFLQDRPLTINDAVAIAFATNRTFASSIEALQRARGRTSEARAALNTTAGINADLTEYDAANTANLGALGGGTTPGQKAPPPFVIVNQFNPVITASAGLPLDISGALHAAASQARFLEIAARIDINRVRNQLVLDVKNAYYNVLRAQAQAAVATDTLVNTLNRLNSAQKNYAAGTSPRFDVITATTDVANAQQGLIQAQSQVSLSLALLKNTLGIDLRAPLRITDQGAVENPPGVAPPAAPSPTGHLSGPSGSGLPGAAPTLPTPPTTAPTVAPDQVLPRGPNGQPLVPAPPSPALVRDPIPLGADFDALVQEAQRTRPEILEADARIAAAQRGIQVARRTSLPGLNLSVGYTLSPNAAGFSRYNQVAGTLGVSIPLFDGGLARARVEQARADVSSAETDRRQAVDQVSLEVQQAYLILLQSRDRVAVAKVGVTQAREASRLAQVRYSAGVSQQVGVSPILELSNAQSSLAQAEANQVNALYDYNNARAQLDRAIGRYSYVGVEPGYPAPPNREAGRKR